ncbi:MAG TPA: MOSC and FAD-binding oxidoreductase domain-containing protein [Trebonia sp.]|jgi:ferredoxin-NADP reductase/MOSC domain-containing protein YiiM/ferredoxin|nr:MOSC and FAD-binding oxidoreductase domain-containing protein [Trebonia sp.]
MPPSLLSLNVGLPRDVPWQGKTVHTGVWKYPVDGPRMVRRLNIDGDGQGDLQGHGGEQRAVLVYQAQSLRHWREVFGRDDIGHGSFGENFSVDGLADDEVCIGDRYRIGEAEFEVTQPRVTCFRVGMRLGEPELPALMVSHRRPGFYVRVIREGRVRAGDTIVKTRSGPGGVTVADTDALLYLPDPDQAKLRAAVGIPALSPGWRGSFRDMLSDAAGQAASAPAWAGFRPLRVTAVEPESDTVTSIRLASADGTPLPAARPGQYLTLRVPGTPGPVRSYSLSSTPGDARYRISVKHEPHGAASGYLTTSLKPGTLLDTAAPRGDFILDNSDEPVLLISAGIGLTPVLAMLHALAARGAGRETWWIHAARSPREHPLAAETRKTLDALRNGHWCVFYSALPDAAAVTGAVPPALAPATAGRLTKDTLAGLGLPATATAYICGPASFMTDMRAALTGLGLSDDRIHTELFGALPPINPGITGQRVRPPHQPPGPPGTGPLVTFARSGISARFPDGTHPDGTHPDGPRSLLEFAESCDVPARWSCRTGVCHTCVTPVLSGQLTYSPDPLSPPAAGQALICCSRPDTDIVLDM